MNALPVLPHEMLNARLVQESAFTMKLKNTLWYEFNAEEALLGEMLPRSLEQALARHALPQLFVFARPATLTAVQSEGRVSACLLGSTPASVLGLALSFLDSGSLARARTCRLLRDAMRGRGFVMALVGEDLTDTFFRPEEDSGGDVAKWTSERLRALSAVLGECPRSHALRRERQERVDAVRFLIDSRRTLGVAKDDARRDALAAAAVADATRAIGALLACAQAVDRSLQGEAAWAASSSSGPFELGSSLAAPRGARPCFERTSTPECL